ncbi:MAG: glycosyltransferase family 2 protein [Bacteroidales bacterium]|jgi:glycosyltransferase involved in cell wall biosynthesis|nr:glycosyltransferase family 2 protein [Bacteroidales bacterium]
MEKVSVIIPCRNEEKYIKNCIDSIMQQDYDKEYVEYIFVDGMSSDKTREIIAAYSSQHSNIRMIDNPDMYVPYALNTGIKNATGQIVIRLDAHSSYSSNYISTLSKKLIELKADNVGCVCNTDVLNKTPKALAIKEVLMSPFGVGNSSFRTGTDKIMEADTVPFGCYNREVFEKFGYYNTKLIRNQDIELNKRIKAKGGKIYLIPDALCTYYARETFGAIAQNNYRNGLWNILTVKITNNFSSLSLRHFIPLIFLLSLILPSAFAALWWPLSLISGLSLNCYLLALCLISLKLAVTKKLNFFYLCWTFIVLHFSYATGSLVGIFKHVKK